MFALLEGELKCLGDIALDENLEDFLCIQGLWSHLQVHVCPAA